MGHLRTALVGGALVAALVAPTTASAASSKGCVIDGGFAVTLGDGDACRAATAHDDRRARLHGARLQVRGRYVTFDVDAATFGVPTTRSPARQTRST